MHASAPAMAVAIPPAPQNNSHAVSFGTALGFQQSPIISWFLGHYLKNPMTMTPPPAHRRPNLNPHETMEWNDNSHF
mgnify:CR=1 FL=1